MPDGCNLIERVRAKAVQDRENGAIDGNQFQMVRRRCEKMTVSCSRMEIVDHEWVIRPPDAARIRKIQGSVTKLEGYIRNTRGVAVAITALSQILEAAGNSIGG